jgi:hypothetical protein
MVCGNRYNNNFYLVCGGDSNKRRFLHIGYENYEGDMPLLMVMRTTKNKQEILKVFQDNEAFKVYKLLTGVNGKD